MPPTQVRVRTVVLLLGLVLAAAAGLEVWGLTTASRGTDQVRFARLNRGLIVVDPAGPVATAQQLPGSGPVDQRRSTAPLTDPERSVVVDQAMRAAVRVVGRDCDGRISGSGFALAGGLLTNAHVAGRADQLEVDTEGGSVPARIVGNRPLSDVALAEAPAAVERLVLSGRRPLPGEPVIAVGFPGTVEPVVVEGTVQLATDGSPFGLAGSVVLLDLRTVPGFSGGPVLDRRGLVIAMLQGYDTVTDLSIAIAAEQLDADLSSLEQSTLGGDLPSAPSCLSITS